LWPDEAGVEKEKGALRSSDAEGEMKSRDDSEAEEE
jgi:hypothetical protein